jgi:hypothetical protein
MNSTLLLLILILVINTLLYTQYQEHFGLFRKDRRYYNLQPTYLSSTRRLRYEGCIGLSLEEHFEHFINCPFLIRTRTIPPPGISLEAIANLLKEDMDMILKYSKKDKIGPVAVLITTLDDLTQTIHFLFPNFMKIRYVIQGEEEPESEEDETNMSLMDRLKSTAIKRTDNVKQMVDQVTEKAVEASRVANQTVNKINTFMKDLNENERKRTREEALKAIQQAIDNRKLQSNVEIPENTKKIIIEPVKSREFISRYNRWFFTLIYTRYTQSGSRCHHPKIFQCPGVQPFAYRTGNWLFGRRYYYFHTPCGTNSISQRVPSLIPTIDKTVFYTLYNPNPTLFPGYGLTADPNISMMTEYDEMLYDCEFMMVSENKQFVCYLQRGYGLCIYYLIPQTINFRTNSRVPGSSTYVDYVNYINNNIYYRCRSDPGLGGARGRLIFRIPLTSRNYACFKLQDNTIFLIDSYEGTDDFGTKTWYGRTAFRVEVNADAPIMLKLSNLGVLKIIDAYDKEYGELSGETLNANLTPDSDYKCSTFSLDGKETTFQPGAGSTDGMKKYLSDLFVKGDDLSDLGDLGTLAKEVDPSLLDGLDKDRIPTSDASGRISGSEYKDARDRLREEKDKSDRDKKDKDESRRRQKELEEDEYIRNTCPIGAMY